MFSGTLKEVKGDVCMFGRVYALEEGKGHVCLVVHRPKHLNMAE